MEETIKLLKEINKNLEELKNKEQYPKLLYVKDIVKNYPVNANTATELCKRYGTKFGGYCIEADRFKEVLQTEGIKILN